MAMKQLTVIQHDSQPDITNMFQHYEAKLKALADQKRLRIMYELCQRGKVCVCDLTDVLDIPQSSLSYHLKMLVDANLILRETHGTWSYYEINQAEIGQVLSEQLCCVFRPDGGSGKAGCC
jgi:ArsR family transcriptional regulator, arsenate/arsenite/antimonite-responsive transcriptional repressor